VNAAAVLILRGIDPIGEPFLATSRPLVREVWTAALNRAAAIEQDASGSR
jgi:hypothetical protein